MPPTSPPKNQSLEGLRGIAALGVVVAHFVFALFPSIAIPPGGILEPHLASAWGGALPFATVLFNGRFQVSIFFALSGFVLAQRVVRAGETSSLPSRALKRYPRLILPALMSVLFAWCLLEVGMMHTHLIDPIGGAGWVMAAYNSPVTFPAALYQGLIGAPLFGETGLNEPLWTIRIELLGSLLLFLSYAKFGPRRPFLVGAVFCIFAAALTGPSAYFFHYATILAGSFFNYAKGTLPRTAIAAMVVIGLILGAGEFSPWFASYHGLLAGLGFSWEGARILSHSVGACLVVFALVMAPKSRAARALGSRVPAWLGRVSYSMYLVHWPIICSIGLMAIFVAERHWGWSYGQALALSASCVLLAVLAVSELFTRFVDAPSTRLAAAFADRVIGKRRDRGISSDVKRLAGAAASIAGLLVIGLWTTTIAAYTDPVVPPRFSQIGPVAECATKPLVRVAVYGDANVPGLLRAALCEDFGGKVAVSSHEGGTTADLFRDWPAEMAASAADVVVINTERDASIPGLDYGAHREQWMELIRVAQGHGKTVVVEAGSPVADEAQNANLWSVTHNQKAVSTSVGVLLVNQYELIPEAVPAWRQLPVERMDRLRASNVYTAIEPLVGRIVAGR